MTDRLDRSLAALAAARPQAPLQGLEDRVWAAVQSRRAVAGTGSAGVRVGLTAAALALGLVFGAQHPARSAHLSELGLLSEDGLLAPSIRLGGGA